MRFWLTVIFGIFVVTGVSTAIYVWNPEMARVRDVEDLTVPLPDPQNSPKAVAVVTEETFKNVPQQKKGETVFKVVNEGVGRLDLKAGKPSCTCVGVELKKEKMGTEDSAARLYLEPGESAEFIVRWDTQERVGEFRVDAPLLTNDPFRKNVPFVVNLEVIPELQQRPEYVEFGTIPQGETPTRDAVFVTKLHEKFELSMDGEHKLFTTKIEPLPAEDLKTLEAKSGYRVVVTAKGPFPVGSFHDGLVLKTTLPKTPIAYLKLNGDVEGKFQMSPTRVDFGTIVDKSANERKVQIFAKGLEEDRQLVVGEITPSFLEARLEKDSKLKVLWRLIVSVPANAPVGPFLGRISVDDNKGDKRLTLAVSGTVSGVSSLETAGAGK